MVQNQVGKTDTMNKIPDLKLKNLTLEDTNEGIKLDINQPTIDNDEGSLLLLWINERHKKSINTMMFKRDGDQFNIVATN